jgi:hypothetical protein
MVRSRWSLGGSKSDKLLGGLAGRLWAIGYADGPDELPSVAQIDKIDLAHAPTIALADGSSRSRAIASLTRLGP